MIIEAFKLALTSIWQYKVRAFLTILGIVIGISSVVMFIAIGDGLKNDITSEIGNWGANFVTIVPGEFEDIQSAQGFSTQLLSGQLLTTEDLDTLERLEGIDQVAPLSLVGGTITKDQRVITVAAPFATTANLPDAWQTFETDKGRFFTQAEDDDTARVIVLGPSVVTEIFGEDADPLGEVVQIRGEDFEVIGTIGIPEGSTLFSSSDYQTLAIVPFNTAAELADGVNILEILATTTENVDPVDYKSTIEDALIENHGGVKDFSVLTADDLLELMDDILSIMTIGVSAIAAISLVVAGVGIMNIMLVSVTERTKEIGLRKAVGATTGAVLWQFLIEAIVLSVIGAIISVAAAWGAAEAAAEYSPIAPHVTTEAVILAVGVGIAVGLIFGIMPAYRAAKMDPLTALRHD